MKKIFFLLLILSLYLLFFKNSPQKTPGVTPLPQEVKLPSLVDTLNSVNYHQHTYPFAYYLVPNSKNLQLFLNLPQSDSSTDLIKKHKCTFLTNGGFYDQNNQPLGWFVENKIEKSREITSRLFNGFIYSKDNQFSITTTPIANADFGLQSGPLLIKDQALMPLKIINDEGRRRVIATLTPQNQLIFITIVSKDSEFNGPLLAETPQVLEIIGQKINQDFDVAINLDGGSASAFYTPQTYIKEFSPIGSYFCY